MKTVGSPKYPVRQLILAPLLVLALLTVVTGITTYRMIQAWEAEESQATQAWAQSLILDNIQIGTMTGSGGSGGGGDPPDTPEVATLIMIGSGLIMLRCGRRWMPRAS